MLASLVAATLCSAGHVSVPAELGQSSLADGSPVTWTDCRWCVADEVHNVYLPGGLVVPAGQTRPVRLAKPADGHLLFDGVTMFEWNRADIALYELRKVVGGFERTGRRWAWHEWEGVPCVAPARPGSGWKAKAKVLVLLPKASRVVGWTADGASPDTLVDFSGEVWRGQATGICLEPASGDVLLCTRWETRRIFRFDATGREVREESRWPLQAYALRLATERGRVWALAVGAARLGVDSRSNELSSFGDFSSETYGIAWGGRGYWLATTQGAQYFPATDPGRCACRVGGLAGVTAICAAKGRVLAAAGVRLFQLWLDDDPDERLSSNCDLTFANRWTGRVEAIEARDARFAMRDAESGECWVYDPEVTQWVFRDRKMTRTNRAVTGVASEVCLEDGCRVRAEAERIVFCASDGRCLGSIPERATALAVSGHWLLAYVPARCAVHRYDLNRLARSQKQAPRTAVRSESE